MNKLWLIIEREYLTRVKKKSFILLTLLAPLIFVTIGLLPVLIAVMTGVEQKKVAVKDDSGIFVNNIKSTDRMDFTLRQEPLDELKSKYKTLGFDGLLYIPKYSDLGQRELPASYFSEEQLSLSSKSFIEDQVSDRIEEFKIKQSGYDVGVLESFKTSVSLDSKKLVADEKGGMMESDKKNSAGVATTIGYISAFVIYIILILYGTMIMRSVMEEKTNRIVEVMISSVKPFQLMMGKIVGVSAVGLTQMLIWIVLTIGLFTVAGLFLNIDPATMQDSANGMGQVPPDQMEAMANGFMETLKEQDWGYILPVFVLCFLGGYFIYASIFAAIGASMGDDLAEGQSLTFVAMFPIIMAIAMITPVIQDPNGTLATWLSFIPLFSPVILPARIPFDPPVWEVVLSVIILALSSFFFVWLSARIYRVGILLYGKKATLKELGKWMFYKG